MSRLASLTPRNHPSSSTPPPKSGKASSSGSRGGSTPKDGERQRSVTPSSTPSRSRSATPTASTPVGNGIVSRQKETTYHRMMKLVIRECKSVFGTWDDLVLVDGLKAGKGCIDEATTMDNILLAPEGPERQLITPHLERLYEHRVAMDSVLGKLNRCIVKLDGLIDQAEKLYFEASRTMGAEFMSEPLWLSWTFERFIDSLASLFSLHTVLLDRLQSLAKEIMDPETKFEKAQSALERWRDLGIRGERCEAVEDWMELVDLEVELGMADEDGEDDEEKELPRPRGNKSKKGSKKS